MANVYNSPVGLYSDHNLSEALQHVGGGVQHHDAVDTHLEPVALTYNTSSTRKNKVSNNQFQASFETLQNVVIGNWK